MVTTSDVVRTRPRVCAGAIPAAARRNAPTPIALRRANGERAKSAAVLTPLVSTPRWRFCDEAQAEAQREQASLHEQAPFQPGGGKQTRSNAFTCRYTLLG
jgi:hypothetical protein